MSRTQSFHGGAGDISMLQQSPGVLLLFPVFLLPFSTSLYSRTASIPPSNMMGRATQDPGTAMRNLENDAAESRCCQGTPLAREAPSAPRHPHNELRLRVSDRRLLRDFLRICGSGQPTSLGCLPTLWHASRSTCSVPSGGFIHEFDPLREVSGCPHGSLEIQASGRRLTVL